MNVRKGLITPYTTLFDGFLFAGKIILLEIVQYIFVFLWSLLFIIPGIGETLRVNGTAQISDEPGLLESFAVNGKPARTVMLVTVVAAFFHCSKAIVRSGAGAALNSRAISNSPATPSASSLAPAR